jgi:hypothetical protein
MRKRVALRILGIGVLHMVLYLYIVPFVIYPRFGNSGIKFVVFVAVLISVTVLGTLFLKEKK